MTGPSGVFVNTTYPVTFQMKNGASWFGASYTRNIVVYNDTIPLASALYGDWYRYNLIYNNSVLIKSNTWATLESPAVNTTGSYLYPLSDYLPTFGSSGPGSGSCAPAPIGPYTLQTTRINNYGSIDMPFKVYIWDDMKMGQQFDTDAAAKRSAKTFIETNLTNYWDRASLITFSDSASVDSNLKMMNQGALPNKTYLESNISQINSWGNTNLYDGLLKARLEFESNPSPGWRSAP
jgi:hypothetical protein